MWLPTADLNETALCVCSSDLKPQKDSNLAMTSRRAASGGNASLIATFFYSCISLSARFLYIAALLCYKARLVLLILLAGNRTLYLLLYRTILYYW